MKRTVIVVFTLALLIASFTFAKTTVVFWNSMGGAQGKALNEIVSEFNSQYPNIEVKSIYVGNYGVLSQKLLAGAVSGKLPTMSQVYSNWTAQLMKSNMVQPMETFIDDPTVGLSKSQLNDIWKAFIKANTWNGEIYTLPFNKSVYVLYVNTDALMLAGIDIPKTISELIKDAKILTVKDESGKVIQYGLGLRTTVDTFVVFLRQMGGHVLSSDYKTALLDSPVALDTLKMLVDLVKSGTTFAQGGYLDGPFGNGRIAMYIDTSAGISYTARSVGGKFAWTIAPVPKGKVQAPPFAGTDVAIFKTATKKEQMAAWEFMKFLMKPQIQAFWAIKTGYLPVVKSALDTQAWKDYSSANPMANVLISQITHGSFDPGIAQWYQIRTKLGNAVSDAMFLKKTPTQALKTAQDQITKLLEESK